MKIIYLILGILLIGNVLADVNETGSSRPQQLFAECPYGAVVEEGFIKCLEDESPDYTSMIQYAGIVALILLIIWLIARGGKK